MSLSLSSSLSSSIDEIELIVTISRDEALC